MGIAAIITVRIGDACVPHVLLVKERMGPPKFKFLSGGLDGKDPINTVRSEIKEEVGLSLADTDECYLCGTMYNGNSRPDWPIDAVQDVCLIYLVNLGQRSVLPLLTIDQTELADALTMEMFDLENQETNMTEMTYGILSGRTNFVARGNTVAMNCDIRHKI